MKYTQLQIVRAQLICKVIPESCPFARTLKVGEFTVKIPPMCKLNPFYDTLMELRFKNLCMLAEVGL